MSWMSAVETYGLWAVFILVALEYACFPLPSEVILPFAGAFAARTDVPFQYVLPGCCAAGLLGCLLCYAVGRSVGGKLLAWVEKRFPIAGKGLCATRAWFEKHGSVSVMLGRVLPLFRTYISLIAGMARQPVWKFTLLSLIGLTVWNTVLVGLGYLLAGQWEAIAYGTRGYMRVALPLVAVGVFVIVLRIRKSAKRKET
ncbi:DedA family protein [Ethanoligenens harbinense]|uniref:SNARE associated Golgi protein-related protein n=1 Tax=Ethanoligenens harbinense (strain DSM 18485 / JCM 12961 / CGMCC 1.5033 / YUAN-3) TaxID=663278 RepID=E6U8D4_ETHHY|nr:DedA family protein [Ethanoligenens harbinense]ADU28253.1 SNARE associated Golgi protein-related protein [Ethanoligenens harbinense YUAN-3]